MDFFFFERHEKYIGMDYSFLKVSLKEEALIKSHQTHLVRP